MAVARKFSDQLDAFCQMAARMADLHNAEAILFLTERPTEWDKLQAAVGDHALIVAADSEDVLAGSEDAQFDTVVLSVPDLPVYEQLTEALLEAVADEHLAPGAPVVAVYSGFEADTIDSLSLIRLGEHLGRLTIRDLKQLGAKVPTETLKTVVDLAVAIGREGREGKPVGSLFIVGDHRKTLGFCKPMGFDPVRGYPVSERMLSDAKVREGVKEIAQMDGAFVVSAKGTVVAACQHVSAPPAELSISKGLGARHWAAAEITKSTTAVAVAVSESNGTVRVFHNGEVVLRIEPFRRAMKWKDFENEPPPAAAGPDREPTRDGAPASENSD
ncbi:DNA integrity scanning protein DisA [Posidoniimonas corsicana]|uniref:DNA integrity scanning protein DisA n=1 Tax=Posidoniimonas corsicana TaxID=1938618 RepID=A0A5C5UYC9_9BACT|nr:DNA integrity scanning protein DisA nucleotide-binding domain protein [Posidoniimonas corsicana]TWT30472.1 DNA integrity scanning protein DisA [Posidoniimonas corsicana]